MSHEIRTPLNGVLGMAHSLKSDNLPRDQAEKVKTILDSGETLMSILNDVLDLSKIEAGRLEIVPSAADLRHMIARVHKLYLPMADEKGLRLTASDRRRHSAIYLMRPRQGASVPGQPCLQRGEIHR